MDYVIGCIMKVLGPLPLRIPFVLSYDIMCQWIINLWIRMQAENFPKHLQWSLPRGEARYAIPKYHFRAHKELGHNKYSLNLMSVGRTDGEEIERSWARHNDTAASTREMGPGSREDTLEDHFDAMNYDKVVNMGMLLVLHDLRVLTESVGATLARKGKNAIKQYAIQEPLHRHFTDSLQEGKAEEWEAMVIVWEADVDSPDPYYIAPTGTCFHCRSLPFKLIISRDRSV